MEIMISDNCGYWKSPVRTAKDGTPFNYLAQCVFIRSVAFPATAWTMNLNGPKTSGGKGPKCSPQMFADLVLHSSSQQLLAVNT